MELVTLLEKGLGKKASLEMLPDQPGDVPVTFADVSHARKLLGYEPSISIEEGIEKFVEWFVEG
jgi:UDP-glucuronate 4-epimerase